MSVSSALQSLRLTAARPVASAQRHVSAAASLPARASSNSIVQASRPVRTSRSDGNAISRPHAPHGHLDQGAAGPSRCFCTSHHRQKASELPLEELHYQSSLDSYRHEQLSDASDYWQPTDASASLVPARRSARRTDPHSLQTAPSIQQLFPEDSSYDHFFTPSVQQIPPSIGATTAPEPIKQDIVAPTSYIDSLGPHRRQELDDRVSLLIRSGERSLPALCAVYGEIDQLQREHLCCYILSQCVKRSQDAFTVLDLYRSWTAVSFSDITDPGRTRSMLRSMWGDSLYRCATYLQAAGLTRHAAAIAADVRMKPSQSRYLLERLVYDLKLPQSLGMTPGHTPEAISTPSLATPAIPASNTKTLFAEADARLAVRGMCDAMINLMADGVAFKRKTVNRMFKLLCLTRARSRVIRTIRAAQRRAQIDALGLEAKRGEMRAAGGFSRLRAEQGKPPQVVSTKVMEDAIRMLCAQDASGARTAYEVLGVLDPLQRTPVMYDALMTVHGSASATLDAPVERVRGEVAASHGYKTVDEQLWSDICTLPHLGGPTLRTISARIVCHTRKRSLDLIRSDLALIRARNMGSIHDLSENAKLGVVRCCIESGALLAGFRYASTLLSPAVAAGDEGFQTKVIATLLRGAQHIHLAAPPSTSDAPRSSPSRAKLLKRFLAHLSRLHRTFPQLQPDIHTLSLLIQLLDRHQAWIETSTLWNMLRLVGGHFKQEDRRLVQVLEAFVEVFEGRDERHSASELKGLIDKLRCSQPSA
ncbi:hypothetical protein PHSY_001821 [Pseudozyma hubeiensis SY62]|uniref:Uncharacterized protein n=1 Tax=Pseudozyma hubeiensis (strain SY62) TaxID=1305764 RepID=R9P837_PSEHS|nr:hypothetical protein PHSY_001821 [Pseudozyma hubeiensis SY62]GAC94250.1 hypothetical protein PHSY_001821 [Pseudozyma hubeiensis SY62]